MNLFNELDNISELIPVDFGGGSPLSKTYLMAYLILRNNLKTFVEIGVYRGKSLFPVTYAIKQNNGISYGIDPYNKDVAREFDVEEDFQKEIDTFLDELDFENIYQNVIKLKSKLGFEKHLELIRKKSSESVEFFQKNNININMVHIDGNHDTKYVMEDVKLFLPLLKPNSIVVMDDINWDSVKPAYEKLKETTTVIFESTTFAILINNKIPEEIVKEYEFELKSIFNIIEGLNEKLLQKTEDLLQKNTVIIEDIIAVNIDAITNLEAIIAGKVDAITSLQTIIAGKVDAITNLESIIAGKVDAITNLESNFNNVHDELLKKDKEIVDLKSNMVIINDELLKNDKEIVDLKSNMVIINDELLKNDKKILKLESNIHILGNSRKSDIYKNFQILFSKYLSSKPIPKKGKLAQLSNIPYLFILLKSKGNMKKAWMDIKGYRAIKRSGLFDDHYYLNKNKNILISGINPLIHYMYYGYNENKFPSAIFDGNYYLNKYGNVKASGMNPLVHYSLYGINEGKKIKNNTKISVVVTSYNHEKYIRECIDSILMQKGVDFELILGDDCSEDNTRKILEKYQKQHPEIIKLLPLTENMGVTKNLKRCLETVTGDYVAICEGDDYWMDHYKLQKQANFLEKRQDCAMCFNSILMFYENDEEKNYIFQEKLTKDTFTTRELILENFIGNFSCCMYRTDVVKKLPDTLYNLFTVDWIFNITCSLYGNIGFLNEQMTVYRKHDSALWSGKNDIDQGSELSEHIDTYNKFLSFKFDSEFKIYKKRLDEQIKKSGIKDLIILDDAFPHPLSAFRLQEYNSYIDYFEDVKVFCKSEIAFPCLNETRPLKTIIENYEKEYPQFKDKVENFDSEMILEAKAIYTIFLANIYYFIDIIEKYKIPFAFTLYPGGGFELNDHSSDKKLKRVFSSPYFRKVIVTQKITKDYLIDNKFCKPDKIEEIFGVVTPLILLEKEYEIKNHFGKDKSNLDICFVAYKYTENGIDKGYDVFIEVAHELAEKYDNIHFHVVGGFDEDVIDITKIKDRISFYGPRFSNWFDEFYEDKDIILSPNMPYKMFDGHFDGFPTGCCTEAGLHKVAIFCTDELNMNTSKFKEGKEMVIIPHNSQKIVEIIEEYYHNPEKLQEIAEEGYLKIKEIYNYENQINPRINVLEGIIKNEKSEKLLNEINNNIEVEKTKLVNSENTLGKLEKQKIKLLSILTHNSLHKTDSLKLNIGCGSVKFPDWVNIDIEPNADLVADVKNGLPINDNSVDYIYNEHFIEHLNFEDGENAVKEFYRVLKPGAVLRLAAPDLDYIINKYHNDWKNQDWLTWPGHEYIKTKGQMINISMREWGHEYVYNEEDLRNLLKKAGFQKITKCELYTSQYSDLSNRETREDSKLIFEAEK
jgi:predicted SAM-dependent methyltransferase/glycosyltransferase involved in cell wall biosynthesis